MSSAAALISRDLDLRHAPTVWRAVCSNAAVVGVRGPVGSGKSTGGVVWLLDRSLRQLPDAQGVRRSRHVVIRNTSIELKTTTIKTVLDWVPEGPYARMTWSGPVTLRITSPVQPDGTSVDSEWLFLALDEPRDIRKLLSLEVSSAWVNEAREVPEQVVDAVTMRVGRYPPRREGSPGASWAQVFMDTNSMDQDHWWWRRFEAEPGERLVELPDGSTMRVDWQGFSQPPAVVQVERHEGVWRPTSALPGAGPVPEGAVLPAAGRHWWVNPKAENMQNLRPGYYEQQIPSKPLDFIECYLANKYVFARDGRPAVPEYTPEVHGVHQDILTREPLILGIDMGGGTLNPAAVVIQRSPRGRLLAQGELIGHDIGLARFGRALVEYLARYFPGHQVDIAWADPAGERRDEVFEQVAYEYLRAEGLPVRAAPTQDVGTRLTAIQTACSRLVDGQPALTVDKRRCPTLHKALSGAWIFPTIRGVHGERLADKPQKSHPYSDVAEALGYALCGVGEAAGPRLATQRRAARVVTVSQDWSPFG